MIIGALVWEKQPPPKKNKNQKKNPKKPPPQKNPQHRTKILVVHETFPVNNVCSLYFIKLFAVIYLWEFFGCCHYNKTVNNSQR